MGVLQWPVVAVPCEHVRLWLWLWLVVLVAVVVAVAMSVGCGRRCGSEHMLQRRYSAPIPHAHVQWCVRGQRGAHSSTVGELCVPQATEDTTLGPHANFTTFPLVRPCPPPRALALHSLPLAVFETTAHRASWHGVSDAGTAVAVPHGDG